MSATSSSSDKYLFLFTTTENDDLTPVKSALQDYYKYPAAADHTFEAKGRANFAPVYKTLVKSFAAPILQIPYILNLILMAYYLLV